VSPAASLIGLLSGALLFAYLLAGVYFWRFWRKTREPLFSMFALAFWLFAVNTGVVALLGDADERTAPAYALRVLGFLLILIAIISKNLTGPRPPRVG
jgi:hypothetical protein